MLSRHFTFWLTLAVSLLMFNSVIRADEQGDAKVEKAAADKKAAEKARLEFYKVPDGNVEELLAFIKKLREYRPKDQADIVAYRLKMQQSLKSAAEKIAQIATDEDKKLDGFNDAIGMSLMY